MVFTSSFFDLFLGNSYSKNPIFRRTTFAGNLNFLKNLPLLRTRAHNDIRQRRERLQVRIAIRSEHPNIAKAFYRRKISFLASWLLIMTTQALGFGWAGLIRKYVVICGGPLTSSRFLFSDKDKLSKLLTTLKDPNVTNIDDDFEDPQSCNLYVVDICDNMRVVKEVKKYRTLGLEFYKSELSFPLDLAPIYSTATFLHANPLETACYNLHTVVTASKQLQLLHGEEFNKYKTLGLEFYKSELSFPLDSAPIYSGRAACDETGAAKFLHANPLETVCYSLHTVVTVVTASKQLQLLHGFRVLNSALQMLAISQRCWLARRSYPNFMETVQRDITHSMCAILVDWLVKVYILKELQGKVVTIGMRGNVVVESSLLDTVMLGVPVLCIVGSLKEYKVWGLQLLAKFENSYWSLYCKEAPCLGQKSHANKGKDGTSPPEEGAGVAIRESSEAIAEGGGVA
ncbi:hypothetical protein Fmac_018609 [Flemingia macrophylla]|uniref:Uncharacterized protein n=1 Tax=Flemingia macrophylla TaxID=520843 RepID=A0ABD1M5F7_9FABA